MTRDSFAVGMANLMVWYKPHPSDLEMDFYFKELEDIPDTMFQRVVDTIVKTRPFPEFPKPADFWTIYEELDKKPATNDDLRERYSCATCADTPGWITYWVTGQGKKTTKDDPEGHFTASPCPECALGRLIREKNFSKITLDKPSVGA